MALFKLAATAIAGYVTWKLYESRQGREAPVAFAKGEGTGENFSKVRNAGPDAMRSDPPEWDGVDEASDESFPASDPPAR